MMYNKIVEDCFFHPRHVGVLDQSLPCTIRCDVGKKGQKTVIELYMGYTEEGIINRVCYKVVGTPFTIAALELLARQIEGRSLDDLPEINHQVLNKELSIPTKYYPAAVQIETLFKELIVSVKQKLKR